MLQMKSIHWHARCTPQPMEPTENPGICRRKEADMKKSRLLAAALAVLIAVSSFPVFQAFAAVAPHVVSDTPKAISRTLNETYQFKFTVYGTHAKPKIEAGNKKVLETMKLTASKDKKGNDVYYFQVRVIGAPGTAAGIYTTLPGQAGVRQCVVNVIEKVIPYRNLYAGFVLQNSKSLKIGEKELPIGDILLGSEKDWKSFRNQYLSNSIDVGYFAEQDIDFKKDAILYHSQNSAKQDVFANAAAIEKVVLENHKPVLYEKSFGNGFRITTTNYPYAQHRYVILVVVKKSDLK